MPLTRSAVKWHICYLESKYASNAPTLPPHLSRHGVTRALARTLAPEIRITATDLNQPMLDFAAAQSGASRVTWRQADALRLPFNEGFKFLVDGENGIIAGHAKDTGQRVFQNVGRSASDAAWIMLKEVMPSGKTPHNSPSR